MIDYKFIVVPVCYFLLSIVFIIYSVLIDVDHLERNEYIPNHRNRWMLRFTFFLTISLVSYQYALAGGLLFAALFDQLINIGMDKDSIWYLGTVAKWDKFWKKHLLAYKIAKFLLLGGSMYLYFS